jgi:hypothetical protein
MQIAACSERWGSAGALLRQIEPESRRQSASTIATSNTSYRPHSDGEPFPTNFARISLRVLPVIASGGAATPSAFDPTRPDLAKIGWRVRPRDLQHGALDRGARCRNVRRGADVPADGARVAGAARVKLLDLPPIAPCTQTTSQMWPSCLERNGNGFHSVSGGVVVFIGRLAQIESAPSKAAPCVRFL